MSGEKNYPVNLEIDYPESLSRWKTFFRPFLALPVLILLSIVAGISDYENYDDKVKYVSTFGLLYIATGLMILFRQKYPRWWFDWNYNLTKFGIRVMAYCALLTDKYPSTDEDQSVHVEMPYPDAKSELNRWLPLIKWFLVLPHYFILSILILTGFFVTLFVWFVILFTGKYPRGIFNFITGIMRWALRADSYAILLITDKYPPFTVK